MYTTLLILLEVAIFTSSEGDFADNILKKQEECDTVRTKVGNVVLDEGGDKFPGIPEEYYENCKTDLDKLKLEYLDKFHLSSSLYPEVFPALLSNETLILLPSPSTTDSSEIPDTHLCSSCESLCRNYEKCSSLFDQINKNIQPSEKVSIDKYTQCMELLNGQKIKFIHDHNISKELLKGASYIALKCKKRPILLTLPRLLKLSIENVLTSHRSEKEVKATPALSKGLYHIDDTDEGTDGETTKSNRGLEEDPQQSFSYFEDSPSENSNNLQEKTGVKISVPILFDALSEDSHEKDTEDIKKSNIDMSDGNSKKKQTNLASTRGNHNNKGAKDNQLVKTKPDKLNEDLYRNSNRYDQSEPGVIVTATPMPEILGDEIFEREADCEEILKMANNVLEYRTFQSVRYYDEQYTECKQSLHEIKYEYAERHGINFDNYKSLFPVVLSTGVERLVSLPGKVSGEPQTAIRPQSLSPVTTSSEGHPTAPIKEDNVRGDRNNGEEEMRIANRTPMYNPAFISNEEFYKYFTRNSQGVGETTFSRLTKMIRKGAGHSDRIDS